MNAAKIREYLIRKGYRKSSAEGHIYELGVTYEYWEHNLGAPSHPDIVLRVSIQGCFVYNEITDALRTMIK